MAQKKTKKKTIQPAVNNQPKPILISISDYVARTIVDNDRCSCGGHIWTYIDDGRVVKKCGDCGYIF